MWFGMPALGGEKQNYAGSKPAWVMKAKQGYTDPIRERGREKMVEEGEKKTRKKNTQECLKCRNQALENGSGYKNLVLFQRPKSVPQYPCQVTHSCL